MKNTNNLIGRYILIFCNFFLLLTPSLGQNIKFRHLSTNDGVSHVSVLSLYMDENNHIWIGTREGLNKYDGLNVASYQLKENDSKSLFSNNVQKITGDKKGNVYVLTTEGISKYSILQDEFETMWQDSEIKAISYSQSLYVGRNREIFIFDQSQKKFISQYTLPELVTITSLLIDSVDNTVYAGTNVGLFVVNNKGNIEHKIKINSNISSIYKDDDGDIWVSSWNDGAFFISGGIVRQFKHDFHKKNSIASNFVRSCCQDNNGDVWIATFSGLNKYNKKTEEFSYFAPSKDSDGLTHSSVWSIIKDHQGTLWLSTYFGGVNYFNPEYVIYTQYQYSKSEKEGLSSPIVGRMTEDGENNLWICTEGAGVNMYNRKTKQFEWYLPGRDTRNSISHYNVKAIYYDREINAMWFGTHLGGLDKLDLNSGVFTHNKHRVDDPQSIPSNIVRDIVPYGSDLFLATDYGVGVFDKISRKSRMLFDDPLKNEMVRNTFALHIDHQDNLWVSVMGEGVYRYNLNTKELKNYRHNPNDLTSLSNNNINSIARDSENKLYFCTSGRGFDVFDHQSETFTNFDSNKNGLISDFVYNILEAAPDDYLIITNLGFSRFNPKNQQFHNYNQNNGFPLSTTNDNALYLTSDGEVFLGGVDGLVSFYLDNLNFTPKDYNILFSKLYVNNREVRVNDESKILSKAFFKTSSIRLQAKYNTFEVEVSTTNYIPSNAGRLFYQLKGFSDEWIPLRDTKITYTNLDAGEYTLIIKSENEGTAGVNTASLNIKILPPFYKTTLAYFSYMAFFFLLFLYLIRSHDKRVKLQALLAYEQKHLQDVERMNQSKLRFFTNISHEFRTPLTVIVGQLNYLINKHNFTSDVYNKILSAYKNSIQMKELISELLDFRKQDQGHMTILATENDIVQFTREIFVLFEEYAKSRDITFTFESTEEALNVWYDSRQLQKVINNLLSNAFKYTPQYGSITLSIHTENNECFILIADSGSGINTDDRDKIFDRFYQVEGNEVSGSGIGLALSKGIVELHKGRLEVESEINKGSTFKIILPMGYSHLDSSQISRRTVSQGSSVDELSIRILKKFKYEDSDKLEKQNIAKDVKILIVEDNEDLREMLIDTFSSIYTVVSASDGSEGLEMTHREMPDIILSDIVMPNMTGIEFCKAVKSNVDICHIPFILLTAKTSIEHNLEGLGIGADDYVTKPFDIEILISRCNNLIVGRRLLQQIFSNQPDIDYRQLATNDLDKKLLELATSIVENNLDNLDFSINQFSKEMGMSRTNLFTKIKGLTGQTPNAFINTMRLRKAAFLLKNRYDLNISEISIITGFNTSHYFSKCFKDVYKQTPSEYRGIV